MDNTVLQNQLNCVICKLPYLAIEYNKKLKIGHNCVESIKIDFLLSNQLIKILCKTSEHCWKEGEKEIIISEINKIYNKWLKC